MRAWMVSEVNHRDRAVLRAVAAGRCVLHGAYGAGLRVDGLWCADQFAGARLTAAGLIVASGATGPAQLTAAGHALLDCGHHARAHAPRLRELAAQLRLPD